MKTTANFYQDELITNLFKDALLLPLSSPLITDFLVGGNFRQRAAGLCDSYSTKHYSPGYIEDNKPYGVYCCNCLARVGIAYGGGLVLSCPFCKRFNRPPSVVLEVLSSFVRGSYSEKAVCKVLDDYQKFWSRDHEPEQTIEGAGSSSEE